MFYGITINGKSRRVELAHAAGPGSGGSSAQAGSGQVWVCRLDGREIAVNAVPGERGVLSLLVDGVSYEARCEARRGPAPARANGSALTVEIVLRGRSYSVELRDPRALRSRRAAADQSDGPCKLLAPMPGKVIRVLTPAGARVEAGQGVLVIEAMKMQNEIKSPKAGVVRQVLATEGAPVNAGEVLAVVD